MEYVIEPHFISGTKNIVSDIFSRVKIDEEKTLENKSIFLVKTRNQTKNELQEKEKNQKEPIQNEKFKYFNINENRNLLIQTKNHDHIFFIFEKERCRMQNQLQYTLKIKLDFSNMENDFYELDEERTIIIMSNLIAENEMHEKVTKMAAICNRYQYKEIAINIDFNFARNYFLFKNNIKKVFSNTDISVEFFLNKIIEVTDMDQINEILYNFHSSKAAGHPGVEKTISLIRQYFSFHNMSKIIKQYVLKCAICAESKIVRHTRIPLQIMTTGTESCQELAIDVVGPISPVSLNNNKYILTAICTLTRFGFAFAMDSIDSQTIAENLIHGIFLKFNCPAKIIPDNAMVLKSNLIKKIYKALSIKHVYITPYRPESNGVVERWHKSLANYFKTMINEHQQSWDSVLDYCVYSYNCKVHNSTNFTPFELMFGRRVSIPACIENPAVSYTYHDYADDMKFKLQKSWEIARKTTDATKNKNKTYYDEKNNVKDVNFELNEKCLMRKYTKKAKFERPYQPVHVQRILSNTTILVRNERGKTYRVHKNYLKKLNEE